MIEENGEANGEEEGNDACFQTFKIVYNFLINSFKTKINAFNAGLLKKITNTQ